MKFLAILGAGIGLLAIATVINTGKSNSETIEKYGFSETEFSAYRACRSDMSGKTLTVEGRGSISPVPKDVCACQSKALVQTFKDGQYDSYENVVAFLSKEPGDQTLNNDDLKNPQNPEKQFASLLMSTLDCVNVYQMRQDQLLEKRILETPKICETQNKSITDVCEGLRSAGRL